MKTKLDSIRLQSLQTHYDIIVGTETWLNDSVYDRELFNSKYIVYRRDRETTSLGSKRGGGVLVAI